MAWHTVDSLFSAGLNQSALDTVNRIYSFAKSMDDQSQIIKAIVYRIKLESFNKENALVNTLFKLNDEIKDSKFPATSLLHSLLAECYFHYYQKNRGRFYNRTQVQNVDISDIQTWDLRTVIEKMTSEFELSLKNPGTLKKTPFNVYNEMISDSGIDVKLRPTLFDFLAHRAINYFSMDDNTLLYMAS